MKISGESGCLMRCHGLKDAGLIDLEVTPMIAVKDASWNDVIARYPPIVD